MKDLVKKKIFYYPCSIYKLVSETSVFLRWK